MVALAIILGIIAIFVVIFNMRIKITVELRDELFLTLSVLGIKMRILPHKPKKYRLRRYTPRKIAKRDARAAKQAKLDAEKKAKKAALKAQKKKQEQEAKAKLTKEQKKANRKKRLESLPPIPDMLSLLFRIIKIFFSGLFKKFHFHVDRLRIKIGGADAAQIALIYVAVTNGLHPVFAFLDKYSNLHGVKNADIEIATDYLSEDIAIDVKLGFSTTIGGILGAALKTVFRAVVGWIKIAPRVKHDDPPTVTPPKSDMNSKGDKSGKNTSSQKNDNAAAISSASAQKKTVGA